MNKCYIVGAAPCKDIIPRPESGDFVIAADGGYATLKRLGITPDLTVGDFDSLNYIPKEDNLIVEPCEKDATDLSLALDRAVSEGYCNILAYGALGGERFEHTIANLQLAASMEKLGINLRMFGDGYAAEAVHNRRICFDGSEKGFISVFAHGGIANGVTISGLKYLLKDSPLSPDIPLGVSNEFTGKPAFIEVSDGTLIIIWQTK